MWGLRKGWNWNMILMRIIEISCKDVNFKWVSVIDNNWTIELRIGRKLCLNPMFNTMKLGCVFVYRVGECLRLWHDLHQKCSDERTTGWYSGSKASGDQCVSPQSKQMSTFSPHALLYRFYVRRWSLSSQLMRTLLFWSWMSVLGLQLVKCLVCDNWPWKRSASDFWLIVSSLMRHGCCLMIHSNKISFHSGGLDNGLKEMMIRFIWMHGVSQGFGESCYILSNSLYKLYERYKNNTVHANCHTYACVCT